MPKPVLMMVLDGLRPDVLRAAIDDGEAPALAHLAGRGEAVWDAVSVFPSITPAATAAIATGEAPVGSGILGHAWYERGEDRVVVYGATRETVMSSGPLKVFHNNVWRMNRDDLLAPTLFERLHEHGIDGACVNFPVRRGPYEHPVRLRSVRNVAANSALLGPSVGGPKEYFMGDLFYSRDTGLQGRAGVGGISRSAGINDEYAARIGAMFLEKKVAPFNLVYFFKGDSITHHKGIAAQREHVATMDGYVARMFEAAGGAERVLEDYAVIALSDHGHTPLLSNKRRYVDLGDVLGVGETSIGARAGFGPGVETVAVPNGRAAFVYLPDGASGAGREAVVEKSLSRRGIDVAAWMEDGWGVARRGGKELRFRRAPGGGTAPRDTAGCRWEMVGDPSTLEIEVSGGDISYGEYPDALERLWGCVRSERCGDVVLSASPGYTFGEVSGKFHVESDHGSLHASDSNVFVLAAGFPEGTEIPRRITDVAPTLLSHFEGQVPRVPEMAGRRVS